MYLECATNIPCNTCNYGKTRSSTEYIVIHYTANNGDTAQGNGNYFKNNVLSSSAHFFVDENEIVSSVPIECIGWHVGANSYIHPYCRNANSIGVELCSEKDSKGNYYFTDETVKLASALVKEIMSKYNIPIENVIRHYDVTGKNCPAPMVENPTLWNNFKTMLKGSENMSYDEAMQFLVNKGVVSTREYWDNAIKCVKYLESLIINIAEKMEGSE